MFPPLTLPRLTSPLPRLSLIIMLLVSLLVPASAGTALAASYQVLGKVTNQAGTAVSGVIVDVINPATSAIIGSTATSTAGTYAVTVEAGTYDVRVAPPEGSELVPAVALNRAITANTTIDFVLVSQGVVSLSGQVKDALGNSIPNQLVMLGSYSGGTTQRQNTDASGGYRFEVAPGTYSLFVSNFNDFSPAPNTPVRYNIDIQPIALTQSMTLDLPLPLKRVAVHVQDATGNPVANAKIATNSPSLRKVSLGNFAANVGSSYPGHPALVTNASGDAVLWLFPTGTGENSTYNITVTPPTDSSFGLTMVPNVVVTEDMALPITMSAPAVLSGRVTDTSGNGVPNQFVYLESPGGGGYLFSLTDSSGTYRFQVGPGGYRLSVRNGFRGMAPHQVPWSYELNLNESITVTQSMTLDLPLPLKRVAVHVQDTTGNPVANAPIMTSSASGNNNLSVSGRSARGGSFYGTENGVVTNASGDAVLWLFPTTDTDTTGYDITIGSPAGSALGTTIVSNVGVTEDMALPITMPVGAVLSGRVTDAGGKGLPDQSISLSLSTAVGAANLQQTTDASGNYRFQVAPGKYHVRVYGYTSASAGFDAPYYYDLRTNEPLTLAQSMTLDLPLPVKRVAVHVQDPVGNPVVNATIATYASHYNYNLSLGSLSMYGASSVASIATNASGDAVLWLFPTPTNGSYTFTVTPPAGTPFGVFNVKNVTVTAEKSEIFALQYVHAPPVTTATVTPAPNASGVYAGPATVSLAATADTSYSVAATYYTIDNGPRQAYTGPFKISGDGRHTVKYWSVDNLGVTETPKLRSLEIAGLKIATESPLPTSTVGVAYTATLAAVGGPQPYRWSIASGSLPPGLTLDAATGVVSGTPTSTGTADFTAQVTSNDGQMATKAFTIITGLTPPNRPPSADPGGTYRVPEGDSVVLSGLGSDPDGDSLTFKWDLDNNGSFETSGQRPSFSAADLDGPSSTPVTLQVCDPGSLCAVASTTIMVVNVTPSISAVSTPIDPVTINTSITASASFTDPGTADTHRATIDWGDGTTSTPSVTGGAGMGSVSGSHSYRAAGIYTVTISVTDDDGGVGSAVSQHYVVVYDPNSGFVTGGGWINSPAGACKLTAPCVGATGRANFGFISKYQKGATAPTGQTEFQFKAGNLNFHSRAYEWLVVAGAKAQYKGTGTINGSDSYGFLLTAFDGQINGGSSGDRFRIKIWDKVTGAAVYDNQMGAIDDVEPSTAIEAGNIVIHRD